MVSTWKVLRVGTNSGGSVNNKKIKNCANGVVANGTQSKREEGWKEVVRKSKKVLVPNNAIARVIGRQGCNINTIREVSGAHIEVEKQKGQGDRTVIIRGSADATRNAHQLIVRLSQEADKDLSEIIRELGLTKSDSPSSPTLSVSSANPSLSSADEFLPLQLNTVSSESTEIVSSFAIPSTITYTNGKYSTKKSTVCTKSTSSIVTSKTATVTTIATVNHKPTCHIRGKKEDNSTVDIKNSSSQAVSASLTSNTVSYTMAVNSKTRSINSSAGSCSKNGNNVKIMSAVFKPSNKSQLHASNRNYSYQPYSKSDMPLSSHGDYKHPMNSSSECVASSKSSESPSKNSSEYNNSFNPLYSNIWTKSNEKPNFASVAASGVNSILSQSSSSSSLNSRQNVEISIDETKPIGVLSRQFVSPGSMSASSQYNPTASLSINTSASMSASHCLGPIGNVRSAPCTPPMANSTSAFVRPKNTSAAGHQLQMNDTILEPISPLSKVMDSFIPNTDSNCKLATTVDYPLPHANNPLQPNSFYPATFSADDSTKHSSGLPNQCLFNSTYQRPINNYMDLACSAAMYNADQKSSIRSSLNPNAPDFATRSNSFSTNTISVQQPMLNFTTNSMTNGSMTSIPSTGFLPNMAPRAPYAPSINTAVRAAIVNYSMNVFQNQVPKQHQEAAARLAHLSAQNSNFVSNDFQNVFIANNAGAAAAAAAAAATANDKIRLMQFALGQFKQQPNNVNSFQPTPPPPPPPTANFNIQNNYGGIVRTSNTASSTSAYSNYVNTTESMNLVTSTIDFTSTNLANTNMEQLLSDDCNNIQRNKQPAPIGTERAQRKHPASFSPQQTNPAANSLPPFGANVPVNSNGLFADPSLQWNINSSPEEAKTSESILQNNRVGGIPFASANVDLNELCLTDTISSLFNQIDPATANACPPQQSPSHPRLGIIDNFNSFESTNQVCKFGIFKPINFNHLFSVDFQLIQWIE